MMKQLFLMGMLAVGLLAACSEDDDPKEILEDTKDNLVGTFSCKIDDVEFKATAPVARKNGDKLVITGARLEEQVTLTMAEATATGEYKIEALSVKNAGTYSQGTDTDSLYSTGGTSEGVITLTEFGDRVSGTFEFSAINKSLSSKSITEGKFENVSVTESDEE